MRLVIDRETGWYFTPTSIKAIALRSNEVLLCRNPRDEWELPGGWPDRQDHSLEDTLRREVYEESGLSVAVRDVVACTLFQVTSEASVVLVIFRADVVGDSPPVPSSEHSAAAFFPVDRLPAGVPDVYANAIGLAVGGQLKRTSAGAAGERPTIHGSE